MKIRVLGGYGSEGQGQRPSAFLVDDSTLVDAGTVGGALSGAEQLGVEHAILSHAHLDHTVGLAFMVDTFAMLAQERSIRAHAIAPVVETLSTHVFNDALWPNFRNIPSPEAPVLTLHTMPELKETTIGRLRVIAVPVSHTVPTTGFVIHDGETGFVYSGDTGPTEKLWQVARQIKAVKALIVETAFPNRMDWLARASKHLTPELLRREMDKMPPDVPVWVYHIKPQLYEETVEELARIDSARIHVLEQGKTYQI